MLPCVFHALWFMTNRSNGSDKNKSSYYMSIPSDCKDPDFSIVDASHAALTAAKSGSWLSSNFFSLSSADSSSSLLAVSWTSASMMGPV